MSAIDELAPLQVNFYVIFGKNLYVFSIPAKFMNSIVMATIFARNFMMLQYAGL